MKFKIDIYIKFILLFFTAFASFLSIQLGLLYLIFFVQFAIYSKLLATRSNFLNKIFTVIVLSVMIVYYTRPLLLYQDTLYFFYASVSNGLTKDHLAQTMLEISLDTFIFLTTFTVAALVLIPVRSHNVAKAKFVLKHNWAVDYTLVEKKIGYLANLFLVLSFIRLMLNLVFGIAVKGKAITSSFAFLARFAPEEFVVSALFTIFILFRKKLRPINKIKLVISLVMLSAAVLATGSKQVLILILFFFLMFYVYFNYELQVKKFFIYTICLCFLIPISFYAGNAVKKAIILKQYTFSNVLGYTLDYAKEADVASAFDVVTNRFIGVDGMIAKNNINSQTLFESFSFTETLKQAFYMLVPFVDNSDVDSGIAVGRVIEQHDDDVVHSGAVGSYASLELMFKNIKYVGIILFSIVLVLGAKITDSVKHPLTKFFLFFFFAYFILVSVMSGNFDFVIAMLLLKLILYWAYFYPVLKNSDNKLLKI